MNWTENGTVVSTLPDYDFNVEGDRDLVANFELVTGIKVNDSEVIPDNFYLSNAYPNPFNPSTKVNFGLPETSTVKILLYNINGQLIEEIVSDLVLPAGNYNTTINAENLSSGMYLYVFLAQSQNSSEKFKKIERSNLTY